MPRSDCWHTHSFRAQVGKRQRDAAAAPLRTLFCRKEGAGLGQVLRTVYDTADKAEEISVLMRNDSWQWWES